MTDEQTIQRGYPPEAHRTLAVDFDGTLFPFGYLMSDPDPLPGAVEAMQRLKAHGYRLVIFTSRLSPRWLEAAGYSESSMRGYVEDSLNRHGIPFDDVTGEKVAAEAYIDDRAIRFRDGEWPAIVDWILFSRNDCE